jgi:hypothetical protein
MAYTCGICKKQGHSRLKCPDKNKPEPSTEPQTDPPLAEKSAEADDKSERRIVLIRASVVDKINIQTESALQNAKRESWRISRSPVGAGEQDRARLEVVARPNARALSN